MAKKSLVKWHPAVMEGNKETWTSQCGQFRITRLKSRGEAQAYYVYHGPRYAGTLHDLPLAQQLAQDLNAT